MKKTGRMKETRKTNTKGIKETGYTKEKGKAKSSSLCLSREREIHMLIGHPAALLRQTSGASKQVIGKGFARKMSGSYAMPVDPSDAEYDARMPTTYYTVLENLTTGERILMRLGNAGEFWRRWDDNRVKKPGWGRPLAQAVAQVTKEQRTPDQLDEEAQWYESVFDSYDDLVASIQLFRKKRSAWDDTPQLREFVLCHDWDGSRFIARPRLPDIPADGVIWRPIPNVQSSEGLDVQSWYEGALKR